MELLRRCFANTKPHIAQRGAHAYLIVNKKSWSFLSRTERSQEDNCPEPVLLHMQF